MSTAPQSDQPNADPAEVGKFDALASRWWDPEGAFKPLHQLNPVRLEFVSDRVALAGAKALDVGCGGGILSESLAQADAKVTGIDMAENVLAVARLHQQVSGLTDIRYELCSAEELTLTEAGQYDLVTCMEVLEHVPNPVSLIKACAQLTRPGGSLFFSTLNRTPKAYLLAIVGAEYVLSMLPKGTHEYEKFIKPSELRHWGVSAGLEFADMAGLSFAPLTQQFSLTDDIAVNYLMQFRVPD